VISGFLDSPVVVAVVAVNMMQVAIYQVICVIAVRNGFMPTIRTVLVGLVMAAATVVRSAAGRVFGGDAKGVFLNFIALDVVQVAIVQIIDVALVLDAGVAAVRAVLMRMSCVIGSHCHLLVGLDWVNMAIRELHVGLFLRSQPFAVQGQGS
jgi:hypothetical protein